MVVDEVGSTDDRMSAAAYTEAAWLGSSAEQVVGAEATRSALFSPARHIVEQVEGDGAARSSTVSRTASSSIRAERFVETSVVGGAAELATR